MRPTPHDVHGVWLDRVQIDHSIDAHDIDVIRALCEVCEPPLTVARLFELLECEQDETVRRGLVEVIRQRAARGEGREVAECYVRLMVRRGARELTAERVQKAVGVSLRIAGEALSACGGVEVREVVDGRRVRVYRFDQVECELVSDGETCDHNLLRAVAALAEQPRVLMHTAARLVSTHSGQALCTACDEIRRMLVLVRDEASAAACGARARGLLAQVGEASPVETVEQYRLDGTYTEKELGWIPHILEIIEASGRIMPFYAALKVRRRLNLSQKETEAVQELIWRMARSGDAGLRVVGGTMVERVPIKAAE